MCLAPDFSPQKRKRHRIFDEKMWQQIGIELTGDNNNYLENIIN